MLRLKYIVLPACLLISGILLIPGSMAQEKKVNQKKIDHDRQKKQKQAEKEYHDAVKKHLKNQSKSTRTMMRQSRKEAGNNTPVKP